MEAVARLHFALAGELDFPWLRSVIGRLPADSHWDTLAKAALRDDLSGMLRALSADTLRAELSATDAGSLIARWKARNAVVYARFSQVLAELRAAEAPDLAMLSVALRELRNLSRT
jgi:glutamate dehydrogenase